jgi:hypothetical protein
LTSSGGWWSATEALSALGATGSLHRGVAAELERRWPGPQCNGLRTEADARSAVGRSCVAEAAGYREHALAPDALVTVSLAELARAADLRLALGAVI